jgi:hypothetical protein
VPMLRFLAWFSIFLACVAAAIDIHHQNELRRYWDRMQARASECTLHPPEKGTRARQMCDDMGPKP